jgi:S-DNA-T family DNA segregation ATPase FtsK/SpoIIIE
MSKAKVKKSKKSKSLSNYTSDERFKLILGLSTSGLAIYLFFSFLSYFFTWKADQSILDKPLGSLFSDPAIVTDNWAGTVGALLANTFIHNWFGIASLSFVFFMIILGFRFLGFRILPLRKTLKYSLIATVWLSVSLGYLFHKSSFLPGGAHGYFISHWLNAIVGKIGTAFILLISLAGILLYSFNNLIDKIKALANPKVKDAPITIKKEQTITAKETKEEEPDKGMEEVVAETENGTPSEMSKKGTKKELDFEFEVAKNEEGELEDGNASSIQQPNGVEDSLPGIDNIEQIEVKVIDNNPSGSNSDSSFTVETPKEEEGLALDIEKVNHDEDAPVKKVSDIPQGDYDPTLDLSNYKLPPVDLLEQYDINNSPVSEDELLANKNRIVETLGNYKIQIDKIKAVVGPTITLYEIVPAPGVRISKIKNLEDDIALSLSALGIRIIAPIPGRGTVGIEVPNLKPEMVSMRSLISSKKYQESKFELPVAMGKTISNETFMFDLTKMPHLLVAGATGQGKSVGLNAILASLVYKKHPAQLKMVLVDPKKVELTLYQKLEKYFLAMMPDADEAIITDTQKVVNTLNSLCVEMDTRYDLLKSAMVRNIKEYNAKFISRKLNPLQGHRFLPYIVVVIDEFADLIMTAGKEVELPIARLAQLARAIGIHLIIATQRPTTNIITGLIKANFPARIAFRVTSMMDSRTILDSPGANQLIGRGDMLFSQGSDVTRLQCAFIDTPELERMMDFVGQQQSYPTPFFLPEYAGEGESQPGEVDLENKDSLFEDAARIIVINQQGSTSLIQRKFSIGYNRAGRIIDQLEAAGVVGPFEGSKARQVLIADEYALDQHLSNMN